jgi:hypothetical protein
MYVVTYWTDRQDYVDADSREAVYAELGYRDGDGTHLFIVDQDDDGNPLHEGVITNIHGDRVAVIRRLS